MNTHSQKWVDEKHNLRHGMGEPPMRFVSEAPVTGCPPMIVGDATAAKIFLQGGDGKIFLQGGDGENPSSFVKVTFCVLHRHTHTHLRWSQVLCSALGGDKPVCPAIGNYSMLTRFDPMTTAGTTSAVPPSKTQDQRIVDPAFTQ